MADTPTSSVTHPVFTPIARFTGLLATAALWVAGLGLVAMTAMIFSQVIALKILNDSIVWSEPAAIILMGWFIFLGAAVGIREGYHLAFDVLLLVLPRPVTLTLHTVSDIAVGGFGAGMIWFGAQLALKTAGNKLPSLGISGAWDFIPIVAGGALIVIFSVERIARRAAGLDTARFGQDAVID